MRIVRSGIIILMLWVGAFSVRAQSNTIDLPPVEVPGFTEQYKGLFFSSPTSGYVFSESDVFHTADGGQTWELRFSVRDRAEQVFFLSGDVAWYRSRRALLRSADGFRNVTQMSLQFQRHDRSEAGAVGSICFLSTDQGWAAATHHVAVTTDGGASWTGQLIPQNLGAVGQVAMFSSAEGVAVTDVGIIRTTDGAATWTAAIGAPRDGWKLACASGAFCVAIDAINTVFVSLDRGTTWQSQHVPIGKPPVTDGRDNIANVQVLSPTAAYIFGIDTHIPPRGQRQVVGPDGLMTTPRNYPTSFLVKYDGSAWSRLDYDYIAHIGIGQFVDAQNGWAASSENNIFRSTDGGQTWTTVQDYFRQIAALTPSPTPFVLPTPSP